MLLLLRSVPKVSAGTLLPSILEIGPVTLSWAYLALTLFWIIFTTIIWTSPAPVDSELLKSVDRDLLACFSHSSADCLELCPFMNLFIHGCPHAETICGAPTLHGLDSLWKELLGWDVPCRHHWLLKFSWGKGSAECDVSSHNLMPFTVVSAWTQGPRGNWFKGRFGKAGEKVTIVLWGQKKKKKKNSVSESQLLFAFFFCFCFFYLFLWETFQTHTE